MPLVMVGFTRERSSVGGLEVALRTLERLDRGLLVNAHHDRILGWGHVEPNDIGGLGCEIGIVALAPAFAPGQIDLLLAQEPSHVVYVDVAESLSDQLTSPAGAALRDRLIEHCQNALVRCFSIDQFGARPRLVLEALDAAGSKAQPPRADHARSHAYLPRNSARAFAFRRQQDDAGAPRHALLGCRCAQPTFELAARLRVEPDLCCLGNHPDVES